MKILFCNITNMTFYTGVKPHDMPYGGGAHIKENYDGSDVYNFKLAKDETYHGFVMTRTLNTSKKRFAQIRIEQLDPMIDEKDPIAEEILVVWVAPDRVTKNKSVIVGWYKDATVSRKFLKGEDGYSYNVIGLPENVVLLPPEKRTWIVPRSSRGASDFGIGQANVWYATKPEAAKFVLETIERINSYNGENWKNRDVEFSNVTRLKQANKRRSGIARLFNLLGDK